jgi:hypothetical protein
MHRLQFGVGLAIAALMVQDLRGQQPAPVPAPPVEPIPVAPPPRAAPPAEFAPAPTPQAVPTPPPRRRYSTLDSSVGYIDNPIPTNQFLLRYDAGYDFRTPNRAEFFYAKPRGAGGPGLPRAERSVDFQDVIAVLEAACDQRWSVFVEVPVRFLNPEVNANTAGLGDVSAGFKYAFWEGEAGVATFQLRVFGPNGDAGRGLGTRHTSLEPALLGFKPLGERLALLGEFRVWVPVGGTDFAGPVLRYGAGLRYDLVRTESLRLAPLVEFVGWTILDGKQSNLTPGGVSVVSDAAGVSIVNVKAGYRLDVGERFGLYAGYGRAITGDRWYTDTFRLEGRWLY